MPDDTSLTDPQPRLARFRHLRRAAFVLLAIVLVLGAAFLSFGPSVDSRERPTTEDVAAARAIFEQLKASHDPATPVHLALSARQIDALAIFASEASGVSRVDMQVTADAVIARASLPLGAGLWINGGAQVAGEHEGFPAIRVTVGRITLPAALSRWAIDLTRWVLIRRGVDLPELDDAVRHFAVADGVVTADLALPRQTGLVGRAVSVAGANVDDGLVARIYCRLDRAEAGEPAPQLASLVRQAFAGAGTAAAADAVAHNRAALVALAFYVVGDQAYNLAPVAAENAMKCPLPTANAVLQQRADLAKHWAFSAGLSAILGEARAVNLGEWKELSDSLPDGSGFSFVDLAANRSGLHVARRALATATADAVARSLKSASDADLLAPALTNGPEGLSDVEFVDRFGALDEGRYQDAVRRIDRHLAATAP